MKPKHKLKSIVVIAALGLLSIAAPAAADWVKSDHVVVVYAGVDKPYAEAIARTVETARAAAVEQFGFDMPTAIRVLVAVDPRGQLRLWNNGRDGISLTIRSSEDLRRPDLTGTHHVYGMCHEVAHMAMYRLTSGQVPAWMSRGAAEGWAHCLGSRLVDIVHAKEGADLWPDRYDYRNEGAKRLDDELAMVGQLDADHQGIVKGAGAWKQLMKIVGDKRIAPIFAAWAKAKYDSTNPAPGLGRVLWMATRNDQVKAWWIEANGTLIDTGRANRPFRGNGNLKSRR